MKNLHWKEQIRRNLEYAKQGKVKIIFNANLYNYLQSRRSQNRQAATAIQLRTKAVGKEILI